MKPVLMIHEIRESLFDLPLKDYVLTFDDGLYNQYENFHRFKDIDTTKIFFISSGKIGQDGYMTLAQVKELMSYKDVYIGGHSHNHLHPSQFDKLIEKIEHIRIDTKTMLDWFESNLGFIPTKFCYPFNEDYDAVYTAILKKIGFTEFYGRERIEA
jgi:Polysaccharide deacetylase